MSNGNPSMSYVIIIGHHNMLNMEWSNVVLLANETRQGKPTSAYSYSTNNKQTATSQMEIEPPRPLVVNCNEFEDYELALQLQLQPSKPIGMQGPLESCNRETTNANGKPAEPE